MSAWHLAQINVGRLAAPHGDARVAGFFAGLDRIDARAEGADGLEWRPVGGGGGGGVEGDGNDAADITPGPDRLFITISAWRDAHALFAIVYRSAHTLVRAARRRAFFGRPQGANQARWRVPAGVRPSVNDGLSRLWLFDCFGPCPPAFSVKAQYPAPSPDGGMHGARIAHQPDPWCLGRV